MSLLWKAAQEIQHEAMAWHEDRRNPSPRGGHPISVRHVGFAGYVAPHDPADYDDGDEEHDGFDEDLHDETTPEPTHHERAHYDEHDEYPQSYYERHDQAYGEAVQKKKAESEPDEENHNLGHFIMEHAPEASTWHEHGTLGHVDLKQPIHATQSHVHTGHLDRYDADSADVPWHLQHGGADNDYLANKHPLFATHEGKVHVIDGHHRVGAALRRGDSSIKGYHVDLDHPAHAHLADPEHGSEW